MNIVVDFDEVLADFLSAFIMFYNQSNPGRNLQYNDFFSYKFWEVLNCSQEQAIDLVYQFYDHQLFDQIVPVIGSQLAISQLRQKGHRLFIATSRPNEIITDTKAWIEKYFPNTFSDILFGNQYSQSGTYTPKSQLCRQLNANIFIDDLPEHIHDCSSFCQKCLLFNRPWNQTYHPHSLHTKRVQDWPQIIKSI